MKKLLTTLLATLMVATLGGTNVFANSGEWDDVGTVTAAGKSVTADVNYTAANISDKEKTDETDYDADDIKAAIYVTVESNITNGTVSVNHTYSQANGLWTEKKTVTDKEAGSAQFAITNYSYKDINAEIKFTPVTTVAKAITGIKDVKVASPFASTFASGEDDETFAVPEQGIEGLSEEITVNFIDDLSVDAAEAALSAAKKMGTFTISIAEGAN